MDQCLQLHDIQEAHERIRPYIHKTPVLTCSAIDEMVGARLYFKCENFQKVGAFKFRGATNSIFSLNDDAASRGVATHSSGNFAAALALAARIRGIRARIFMPENAPPVKVAAVKSYGGEIVFCDSSPMDREETADRFIQETGAMLIHPANDLPIIAGQGTVVLELLDSIADLDFILAPVGGGGLISGTAVATKEWNPQIQIVGCEPKNADDAYRSLQAGKILPSVNPDTIADGLRTSLGSNTFPIIRDLVDDVVLATEEDIVNAMRIVWERMKIVIEPSSAVPLAVLLSGGLFVKGKKVGVIISGGNVDFSRFFEALRRCSDLKKIAMNDHEST